MSGATASMGYAECAIRDSVPAAHPTILTLTGQCPRYGLLERHRCASYPL